MTPLLLLLVIFLFGYLVTHLLVQRLRKTQYLLIGIEYVFLGVLIGPAFSNWLNYSFGFHLPIIINPEILFQIKPGILIVLGFLGFIIGLKFNFKYLLEINKPAYLISFIEILFSFIFLGGISFVLLYLTFFDGNNLYTLIKSAYFLAIAGFITSHSFIQTLFERYNLSGSLSKLMLNNSYLNINVGLLVYGFLFGIFHARSINIAHFTSIEWVVLSIFFSTTMGLLFFLFLGNEKDENKIYLAIIGIVVFSSAAAYLLKFSPLFINFIIGAILANVSKISKTITEVLEKIYQPTGVLIVIFSGIFWIPSSFLITAVAIILFILLRYIAKISTGYFTYAALKGEHSIPKFIGSGLLSVDIIICAMVIEFGFIFHNPINNVILTAVLASVVFYNFYGFYKAKNFLVDFDDIKSKNL
ncbi:MAG: hypothetical protein V1773_09865 [bacterium]